MKKFVLILVTFLCAAIPAKDLPKIAVYVTGDVPDNLKKALGTEMLTTLVKRERYRGIERHQSFLAEIDNEQGKQRSGAIDDNQISEVGRQFGVEFVCIADITPVLGEYQISARIINVETAEVVFIGRSTSSLETLDDLTRVSDRVAKNMFNEPTESVRQKVKPVKPKLANEPFYGLGGSFSSDLGGGIAWPDGRQVVMPYRAGGVYVSLDAIYAELFLGVSFGGGKWESADASYPGDLPNMQRTYGNIGMLAKYPLPLGSSVRLFPLLGIDYNFSGHEVTLTYADGNKYVFDGIDGDSTALLNTLWFQFGGGIDFYFGGAGMILRVEALYGLRTATELEKHLVAIYNKEISDWHNVKTRPGKGLTLKVSIGVGVSP